MVNFLISFLLHLMTLNLDDAIKKLEVRIYSIVTNLTWIDVKMYPYFNIVPEEYLKSVV